MYQAGKLKLDELITKRYTLDEINQGYTRPARRQEHPGSDDPRALTPPHCWRGVDGEIVGLRREAEVLAATLAGGCHVVLEGPPGTGKSTLLRAVAQRRRARRGVRRGQRRADAGAAGRPPRPRARAEPGYRPDTFVDGPLLTALRGGALLYIEELNRVPEETLNVLVGALAEGEIHVPRLGRVPAGERFRLIAAMNPFDAVGTARVSQAISDRMCRIAIGYQDDGGRARDRRRA